MPDKVILHGMSTMRSMNRMRSMLTNSMFTEIMPMPILSKSTMPPRSTVF